MGFGAMIIGQMTLGVHAVTQDSQESVSATWTWSPEIALYDSPMESWSHSASTDATLRG